MGDCNTIHGFLYNNLFARLMMTLVYKTPTSHVFVEHSSTIVQVFSKWGPEVGGREEKKAQLLGCEIRNCLRVD